MENIEINKFITQIISLTKSIVIKIEDMAIKENILLRKYGYDVSDNKREWRYYLNLSGEYHASDEIMYVTSLDNGEEIVFNKDNLLLHPITKRYYLSMGYRYDILIKKYSGQIDLINGILNPIDMDKAIEAENYKILRYNSSYVQDNEHSLITYLNNWIYSQFVTYMSSEYKFTDDLFLTAFIAEIYSKIPAVIFNNRLKVVHTWEAHDFHIWSHINGHGDFNKYKKYLNEYQKFWLYKNISYLKKHSGKTDTLNMLIQNILTVRNIPLCSYDLICDTSKMLENGLAATLFKKLPVNYDLEIDDVDAIKEPSYLINKEIPLATNNSQVKAMYLNEIVNSNKILEHSSLPSKIFESEMTDFSNSNFETLIRILLWESIYLAKHDIYSTVVDVKDPVNGKKFKLPVKDAITLWSILTDNAYSYYDKDYYTKYIPHLYYYKCFKVNPPQWTELRKFGGVEYLPDELLQDIVKLTVEYENILSPEYLYLKSEEVFNVIWKYKKMYSRFHDFIKQESIFAATEEMFDNGICTLTDFTLKEQFLNDIGMDISEYTYDDLTYLAWDIFVSFTGWDLFERTTLSDIQTNLIELMLKLSSYSIHVISDTINSNNTGWEWRCNLSKSEHTISILEDDALHIIDRHYVRPENYDKLTINASLDDIYSYELYSDTDNKFNIDIYEDEYLEFNEFERIFEIKDNSYYFDIVENI